jgi:adenosylhomocysteine nucleosidase
LPQAEATGGADAARRVALLAPMRHELRPLLRPLGLRRTRDAAGAAFPGAGFSGALGRNQIVAAITGIGVRAAAQTAERVLDSGGIDHLVVVGIAGGIAAGARIGDIVVPELVIDLESGAQHRPARLGDAPPRGVLATSGELVSDREALVRLRDRGVVAIDMETAAVAAVCERRGCRWSVFRAISDHIDDAPVDPAVFGLAGPDGGPNPTALLRFLLTRPWKIPELARLARDMRKAANAAAQAAVRGLAQG